MVSNWLTENTKIFPSPIRPVRTMSTILRMISSARASSTHKEISTLGRKAQRILAVAVLIQIALLASKAFHLADRQRLQRGPPETLEDLFRQEWFDDRSNLFHRSTPDGIQPRQSTIRNRHLDGLIVSGQVPGIQRLVSVHRHVSERVFGTIFDICPPAADN